MCACTYFLCMYMYIYTYIQFVHAYTYGVCMHIYTCSPVYFRKWVTIFTTSYYSLLLPALSVIPKMFVFDR